MQHCCPPCCPSKKAVSSNKVQTQLPKWELQQVPRRLSFDDQWAYWMSDRTALMTFPKPSPINDHQSLENSNEGTHLVTKPILAYLYPSDFPVRKWCTYLHISLPLRWCLWAGQINRDPWMDIHGAAAAQAIAFSCSKFLTAEAFLLFGTCVINHKHFPKIKETSTQGFVLCSGRRGHMENISLEYGILWEEEKITIK